MGEEEKKPGEKKSDEAKKVEEKKKEETPKPAAADEKKDEKKPEAEQPAPPPPPPQEIVLKVFMHCEGCARKVRRCLKGFEGVEDVITDCRTSKVVVKGEKADPFKVLDRVQRKSHRQVELISPIPKPPAEEPKKPEVKEVVKAEEKKEEPPVIITVVLGVYMHCEACAQEIKKRIQRMEGVESAEPDPKSSQVKVKGVFEPEKLTDYVYKRTGKHAVIIKSEPEKKEEEKPKEEKKEEEKPKEEKKEEEKPKEEKKDDKEKKEDGGGSGGEPAAKPELETEEQKMEVKKNEFYYYHPQNYQVYPPQRFAQDMYAYPPQMFSDENPNACSVM